MGSTFCMRVSACLYVYSPINLWMQEQILMKGGMHIIAPDPISKANSLIPPISNTNITSSKISEAKL